MKNFQFLEFKISKIIYQTTLMNSILLFIVLAIDLNFTRLFSQTCYYAEKIEKMNVVDALESKSINPNKLGQSLSGFTNALTDILIERTRDELSVNFFERLIKNSNKYEEFKILFPITYDALKKFPSYQYNQYINFLRVSFHDDFKMLPYHVTSVLMCDKYKSKFKENRIEFTLAIKSLRLLFELIEGSKNSAEIINSLSDIIPSNLTNSENLGILEECLGISRNNSERFRQIEGSDEIWISKSTYNHFILQKGFNELASSKLITDLSISKKITGINYFDSTLVENKILEFVELGNRVNEALQNYKNNKNKQNAIEYLNSSLNIIEFSIDLGELILGQKIDLKYKKLITNSCKVVKYFYSENYSSGIQSCKSFLTNLLAVADPKDTSELVNNLDKIMPLAVFCVNLVEAKDEEGIKAAIRNAVLPVGSSSIKKNVVSNISLQSYVGFSLVPSQFDNEAQNSWESGFSITAPIGMAFSWKLCKKGGAFSLFPYFVDLGAIVDYKIQNGGAQYEIKFGKLVSPGIGMNWGIPNVPLSLGLNYQFGPGIENIRNSFFDNSRFTINFMVDIPLLNFRTR